jgi:hypothetical protein
MNQSTLSQIEESFSQLPVSEQRRLIERLVRRLNEHSRNKDEHIEDQLVQMATDPDIQREIQEIEREFAFVESDGLENAVRYSLEL